MSRNDQKQVETPKNVSHVYVKQHETRGLDPRYRGPFKVISNPTRSSLEIKAGLTARGEVRSEWRAWADCKPAHINEDTVEASRPKRGRPPKPQVPSDQESPLDPPVVTNSEAPNLPNSNDGGNSSRPTRSTRNPAPNYVDTLVASIDFSRPPPSYHPPSTTWTASRRELEVINRSIRGY